MLEADRPAFYASTAGGWRDWWTLLHPPYTAWHLSYVVLGAALATRPGVTNLLAAVLAFFFALGVGAHALDELNGRPLATRIPDRALVTAAVAGIAVAVGLGVAGVIRVSWVLVPFIVAGCVLVVGYNLELLHGRLHSDWWFAAGWGAFPVLTGCAAQHGSLTLAAVIAAVAAFFLSRAQRALSTPARTIRRRTRELTGRIVLTSGVERPLDRTTLLAPLELALRSLSWAAVLVAAAVATARL